MKKVMAGRVWIGGHELEEAFVELRSAAILVDPVRSPGKRDNGIWIRALGSAIRNFHQSRKVFVGPQPRIGTRSGGIGWMKLRLVPHDPFMDPACVVTDRLVYEAAPVVARIVIR